ncbi:DUF1963 domain-containing protein [Paenibacillus albidus]|uniref:DUF1963 domain-containing protein n=1 Tax=Paenibacillus albidus TaxID=2041023 RepID=UPI0020357614|nr:DUF1963 domain-containing protein [Paenibacillus albidus]
MDLDAQGEPRFSVHNRKPDYLEDIAPEEEGEEFLSAGRELFCSVQPRNGYHAVQWALDPAVSQIGGHPTWVQDAEYPPCPCCSRPMRFVAQLDWAQLEDYGEGIYYMFICAKDRITATTYQQS